MERLFLVALLIQVSFANSLKRDKESSFCDDCKKLKWTYCQDFESTDGFTLTNAAQEKGLEGQGLAIKGGKADWRDMKKTCIMNPSDCKEGFTLSLALKINISGRWQKFLSIGRDHTEHISIYRDNEILSGTVGYGKRGLVVSNPIPLDTNQESPKKSKMFRNTAKKSKWFRYTLVLRANNTLEGYVDDNAPVADAREPRWFATPKFRNTRTTLIIGSELSGLPSGFYIVDNLIIIDKALEPDQIKDINDVDDYYRNDDDQ